MSEPTKKPREFNILQDYLRDHGDCFGTVYDHNIGMPEDVIRVREVSPAYDAMVVAMAEALVNGCWCGLAEHKTPECSCCEALALYREWTK